jgi:hypothetical protein
MLGVEVIFPHWISTSKALPLAKLMVEPQGFPFMAQIRGYDDERLIQLASANPDGFPWVEGLINLQINHYNSFHLSNSWGLANVSSHL